MKVVGWRREGWSYHPSSHETVRGLGPLGEGGGEERTTLPLGLLWGTLPAYAAYEPARLPCFFSPWAGQADCQPYLICLG